MSEAFSLRRTRAILMKEFKQLLRDKVSLRMIIMIPIMQLLLFGYALNTDPKHLPTAVLSQDNSAFARSIVAGLRNTEYFSINRDVTSAQEGQRLLQSGEVLFVVTIPPDFEKDLVRGRKPELLIEADATDPVATSGALNAVNGVLDHVMGQVLTGPLGFLRAEAQPVQIFLHKKYNPEGFTRYNIVPGLIAIILTMTGIMMTALSMTRERERGTMENLLAMPVRPVEVMIGKIAPYVLIGYLQSLIILVVAEVLFGVPIIGSLVLLASTLMIFIICNMALGFTISAAAENQTQALQMSIMVFLPSIMLSGFLFPFSGMPHWAQMIGNAVPATHFIVISRAILLKGSDFASIWPHVWPLILIMFVIMAIALKRYRQTLD